MNLSPNTIPEEFEYKHEPKGEPHSIEVKMHPETFRIIAYVNFWLMVVIAATMTHIYVAPHHDLAHSPLVSAFGYNNICILWDFTPSLYFAAMMFPFVSIPFQVYIFLIWFRTLKAYQQELVSYNFMLISTISSVIEVILLSWFAMTFVISPFVSLRGHTLPFEGLQVFLLMNALHNFFYSRYVINTPRIFDKLSIFYAVLLSATTVLKVTIGITNIFGHPIIVPTGSNQNLLKAIDMLWMFLAAVVPLFLAIYFHKKMKPLRFIF